MEWGLLGPGKIAALRRTRGLGLGSAVRHYNEVAVPGMSGLWFAKPVFLSLVGIALVQESESVQAAKNKSITNIQAANAVEGIGCWLGFQQNGWVRDNRLLGRLAFRRYNAEPSFGDLSKIPYYVSQPMRVGVTAALPALGLVEKGSSRFNTMRLSDTGRKFLEAAWSGHRPYNRRLIDHLTKWLKDEINIGTYNGGIRVLSPREPLSDPARDILREQILNLGPDAIRRRAIFNWLEDGAGTDWAKRPNGIQEDHWHDLQAGARFFDLRNAIFGLLDLIEEQIGTQDGFFHPDDDLPSKISDALKCVRSCASEYREHVGSSTDPNLSAAEGLAKILVESQDADALFALVERDGRVLMIKEGRVIKPGPVFNVQSQAPVPDGEWETAEDSDTLDDDESPVAASVIPALPDGISGRVRNLFLMMADINGHLEDYL